ncbi:hypothetical protein [Halarcobacter bivalviorum]|uniref:Uncharacterized protein n=1 Tax=Halarcobacter bivalviorum TaxID=663364 RepID=A0AAX2A6K0_9BACT|nr:hypothetical protein [Halarcobacter bivalviorum]AXH11073.1 hypothetical protein ABIV_0031 [Halarcobacter bivalviorum]RXK09738.1 hypothetical protein CRV05_08385 [Halarcobacter bivalviorum]
MDRLISKEIRNDETDVLKLLTIYAKNQGSKSPEKLYMVYTKLVYKTLDIESGLRGHFTSSQLSIIATLEIMIAQTVIELMKENIHYKIIYQLVKKKLQQFVGLITVKEIYSTNKKLYSFNLAS